MEQGEETSEYPASLSGQHFLLALNGAKDHPLYRHELLPGQGLTAAGAHKTFFRSMPVEVVVVTHALRFRVNSVMTTLAHRCMVLHIAWFTGRLVIHHDVDLSSQDTVTIKTAKVLHLPVLVFCLSILVSTSLQVPPSVIRRLAAGGKRVSRGGLPPSLEAPASRLAAGLGFAPRPPRVFYGERGSPFGSCDSSPLLIIRHRVGVGWGAFREPRASPLSPCGPPSCGALHLGSHH
ncbi:hypothetical protein NDU88_000903 [Pleurodeles waltl]|uniref:Uncharacterized protein n=1 Tax=Pleurodeles waltl TaxID=8319 RepID=A0AAV7LZH5_PLEWA|nr:hypothetical protein NDU88_000903 [Pleurodeles waltl]